MGTRNENYQQTFDKGDDVVLKFAEFDRNNYIKIDNHIYNIHIYPEYYAVRFEVKPYDENYEVIKNLFNLS